MNPNPRKRLFGEPGWDRTIDALIKNTDPFWSYMDPESDEWGEPDRPGGWLPDMPPKAIIGNADLQEFLTSKATNPGDKRDYTAWDIARRKSSARSVTVEPKAIPT